MDLLIKNVKAYIEGRFEQAEVFVSGGKICSFSAPETLYEVFDGGGAYLVPGFIDIHTHGGFGTDVNSADVAAFERLANFFVSKGTTSFLASVLTDTRENTLKALNTISDYNKSTHSGANLLGAHLEGPFLSPEKKGAMPENLLKQGDNELLESYLKTGVVKYITVAPEVEGVLELIKKYSASLTFAIGHSQADFDTSTDAINLGAKAATHTFNAMAAIDRTEPNILGAALDSGIFCEIIADGVHVHPANIRMLYRLKGNKKIIAITDSIQAAGLPDGEYKLGCRDVTVKGINAFLKGGRARAGSVLTMDNALKNLMSFLDISAEKALPMLTENPADLFKLNKGYIKIGYDADFTLLNRKFDVIRTIIGNKI